MASGLPAELKQQDAMPALWEFGLGAAWALIPTFMDIPNLISHGRPIEGFLMSTAAYVVALALFRVSVPLMLLVAVTGSVVHLMYVPEPTATLMAWPWMTYIVSRWHSRLTGISFLAAGITLSVFHGWRWMSWIVEAYGLNDAASIVVAVLFCCSSMIVAFLVGRVVAQRAQSNTAFLWDLWNAQEEFNRHLREEVLLASAATRMDISRELHDILAHSLTGIVRLADGGAAVGEKRPKVATEALREISTVGREGLHDIRTVIGALRSPNLPEADQLDPPAGLARIEALVERVGDRVELRVAGEPDAVPSIIGATAYRIVQESLTNFLKHAGAQERAIVSIVHTDSRVEIDVSNTGGVIPVPDVSLGHGIRGMGERVTALHGELDCGPLPDGGFAVHASLPIAGYSSSVGGQVAVEGDLESDIRWDHREDRKEGN